MYGVDSYAKEVFLLCKVTKQSRDLDGSNYLKKERTVSLSLDEKRVLLNHDREFGNGCKSDELTEVSNCSCYVNKESIGCELNGKEKYANIALRSRFDVNRFTGRITGYKVVENIERNRGAIDEYDGMCEKYISPKF